MITLVEDHTGDWMGVYNGEELLYEGHSIDPKMLLDIIGIGYLTLETHLEDHGFDHLPDTLGEAKKLT